MADIYSLMDLFFSAILSTYNTMQSHMGIYFTVWFACMVILPLMRKIIKSIMSN